MVSPAGISTSAHSMPRKGARFFETGSYALGLFSDSVRPSLGVNLSEPVAQRSGSNPISDTGRPVFLAGGIVGHCYREEYANLPPTIV